MEDNKTIDESRIEEATGGIRDKKGWKCDMCGRYADIETYDIRIDYHPGTSSIYLGKKDVCYYCRNTHLSDYVAEHYSNLELDGIYMNGPL